MDVGAPVHHAVADIEGNHLSLTDVASGIGNACDHRDAKALANHSGMALAAVFFCDHSSAASNRFEVFRIGVGHHKDFTRLDAGGLFR